MNFNNNSSMVGFIGSYKSVEDVISSDTKELQEIGGTFEAIADRMKVVIDYFRSKDWEARFKLVGYRFDDKLRISRFDCTKGFQQCPYNGCTTMGFGWSEIIVIENPLTKRKLTINQGTEHLVRAHHLLEKGNEYGISAREFYEHFIKDKK